MKMSRSLHGANQSKKEEIGKKTGGIRGLNPSLDDFQGGGQEKDADQLGSKEIRGPPSMSEKFRGSLTP